VILLWLGLLVVALVMIVAGWYGYGTRKASTAAEEGVPTVSEPAAPAAATPPAATPPAPAPQAVETPTPALEAEVSPATAVAVTPKPVAKPRKQATVAAPSSSAPEIPAPAVAAAPSPAAPAPSAEPQTMCGDRNFIAKAQCMATQCLKPEYKAHAQCEAVRRQQRIEEEKRNPTLIN
jgi:cytoskeletal protein RodZ